MFSPYSLVPDVLTSHGFILTGRRDKVSSSPKVLPYEVALPLRVRAREVNCALPFDGITTPPQVTPLGFLEFIGLLGRLPGWKCNFELPAADGSQLQGVFPGVFRSDGAEQIQEGGERETPSSKMLMIPRHYERSSNGSAGRIRTYNPPVNSRTLYR